MCGISSINGAICRNAKLSIVSFSSVIVTSKDSSRGHRATECPRGVINQRKCAIRSAFKPYRVVHSTIRTTGHASHCSHIGRRTSTTDYKIVSTCCKRVGTRTQRHILKLGVGTKGDVIIVTRNNAIGIVRSLTTGVIARDGHRIFHISNATTTSTIESVILIRR